MIGNKKIILVLLFCLIFPLSVLYSVSIDDYIEKYIVINDDEPFFLDIEVVILVDDGTIFILKKLNPYYDVQVRSPYSGDLIVSPYSKELVAYNENESFYFILSEDKKHILYKFDEQRNYIQKFSMYLTANRQDKYENVTSYKITFPLLLDYELQDQSLFVWLDNKSSKYHGSLNYPPVYFNDNSVKSDEEKEVYDCLKDMYIDYVEKELNRCQKLFYADVDYRLDQTIRLSATVIKAFDEQLAQELFEKINLTDFWQNKTDIYKRLNTKLLSDYCRTVNMIQNFNNQFDSRKWFAETRPNIKDELPTTKEEMLEYLRWQSLNFKEGRGHDDAYGTSVRFEIIPEGLKATSAGKDKVFDTDDDQYFVRTYESVGMKPLN